MRTWKVDPECPGGVDGTREVGIFVLWTGDVADLPMRCKLNNNLEWGAYLPCDLCTNRGDYIGRGVKHLGYSKPCDAFVRDDRAWDRTEAENRVRQHAWTTQARDTGLNGLQRVKAYSSGRISGRGARPGRRSSTFLTDAEIRGRNSFVDREAAAIRATAAARAPGIQANLHGAILSDGQQGRDLRSVVTAMQKAVCLDCVRA